MPFVEDLGSGAIVQTQTVEGLEHEPTPAEVMRRGVDLVCFSGDKLFGGPQAGIIVGRKRMIDALKREPLFRALRCDKLILSALEATVDTYLRGDTRIPVLEMMQVTNEELRGRAERIVAALDGRPAGRAHRRRTRADRRRHAASLRAAVGDDRRETSHARSAGRSPPAFATQPVPVIGYVSRGSVKLDLRTVFPQQDADVISALLAVSSELRSAMSDATHYIVATAGHVDHGKSALIKALTGTDPDRLPEEKARGITIDLGFAHLELPSPTSPSSLHVGIVDVPGHEDFVKNMVAGVGSIDLALLVVAADDGWMPQTEEHLQILTYVGVRRAVVALTKADLAEDEAGRGVRGPSAAAGQRVCRGADRADLGPDGTGPRYAESDAGERALRGVAVTGHRQAPVGRRSGLHVARNRHRGDGNAGRGHTAARPVGRHSTGRAPRTHPPDPVARPRRRRERTGYPNRAEPGRRERG